MSQGKVYGTGVCNVFLARRNVGGCRMAVDVASFSNNEATVLQEPGGPKARRSLPSLGTVAAWK